MEDLKSVEIANDIKVVVETLVTELNDYSAKKKKVAAKRARKQTLELSKLFKEFRKQSVADCKTF